MIEMREKLEKIFVERAMTQTVATKLERMPLDRMGLGELLYHAVVECGKGCQLLNGGAMQGA